LSNTSFRMINALNQCEIARGYVKSEILFKSSVRGGGHAKLYAVWLRLDKNLVKIVYKILKINIKAVSKVSKSVRLVEHPICRSAVISEILLPFKSACQGFFNDNIRSINIYYPWCMRPEIISLNFVKLVELYSLRQPKKKTTC
jgi:hypothetical protein